MTHKSHDSHHGAHPHTLTTGTERMVLTMAGIRIMELRILIPSTEPRILIMEATLLTRAIESRSNAPQVYSKVFRWQVDPPGGPLPVRVEIVGSFTGSKSANEI